MRGIKLYFSSIFIYALGLLLITIIPFYQTYLMENTKSYLFLLFFLYLIISPLYYFFTITETAANKPYLIMHYLKKTIFQHKFSLLNNEEKNALLFLLVKFFFLPLMLNFFLGNIAQLINTTKIQWYPFLFTLLFTIDTLIFTIGYSIEFSSLKNIVKSVEPTFFGWFVALICYPPFNQIVGDYIPWGANDYINFGNPILTTIMRIFIILLLIIYVWATLALGFKSSNLTNRGIITKFPYSLIRHPAYISKNLMWWLTLLPVITIPFALGMLFWSIIYFFRAYTEERHLSQDANYVEYKQKVKCKFIPYLY